MRTEKVWNEDGYRETRELPPHRVCAWCGCVLLEGGPDRQDGMVSHGICPPCAEKVLAEMGV